MGPVGLKIHTHIIWWRWVFKLGSVLAKFVVTLAAKREREIKQAQKLQTTVWREAGGVRFFIAAGVQHVVDTSYCERNDREGVSWAWVPQGRSNVGFYGDDVPIFYSEPVPVAALRLFSVAPGVALRKPLFCIQTAAIKANC